MSRLRIVVLLALLLPAPGCRSVPYWAKQDLARRVMQIDDDPLEEAFRNKMQAAREVSGGRPGHSAGGGCGCGN